MLNLLTFSLYFRSSKCQNLFHLRGAFHMGNDDLPVRDWLKGGSKNSDFSILKF